MECFALISQVNVDKESVGKRRNGDTKSSVLVSTILHTNTGKTQNVPIKEVLYIEKWKENKPQRNKVRLCLPILRNLKILFFLVVSVHFYQLLLL